MSATRARSIVLPALLALLLGCPAAQQGEGEAAPGDAAQSAADDAPPAPEGSGATAIIDVDGFGEIHVKLLPEVAPGTVANFEKLAGEGFYAGTTFHRVIPGFMIQGGDPNTKDKDPRNDGRGGPGYQIKAEFNATPHQRGVVSMARSSSPDSAGSQFFVVHQDSNHLDGKYTAFGQVTKGLDVVDRIADVETDKYGRNGPRDRPLANVTISAVRIEPMAGSEADEDDGDGAEEAGEPEEEVGGE